jgi:hypothetical protein
MIIENNIYKLSEIKKILDTIIPKDEKFPKFSETVNLNKFIKKNSKYFKKKKKYSYIITKCLDENLERNIIFEYFTSKKLNDRLNVESNLFLKKNNFSKLLKKVINSKLVYKN